MIHRLTFIVILLLCYSRTSSAQETILIAAASDLKFALDSVIAAFNKDHVGKIETSYGSSGKFHEQILHGAPFDLFFSADISYPAKLKEENMTSSEVYAYAKGRIVLWSKSVNPAVQGMLTLKISTLKKIAIANPMHAPYGKRAMESIAFYNLTTLVTPRVVYGENIAQTAQFVSSGAADIGIIALSLALSPTMQKEHGHYFLIPEESHQPLVQGMVVTKHGKGNKLAQSFFAYVKGEKAGAILKHFGFSKP